MKMKKQSRVPGALQQTNNSGRKLPVAATKAQKIMIKIRQADEPERIAAER